ncbi:MAG: aspartate carbamoyltransferase [Candidatus Aenigmarchaeota archaeon]|nr:aspartate carbamoyltransferase [Candidatus Aenigmarchaeota archaeon]
MKLRSKDLISAADLEKREVKAILEEAEHMLGTVRKGRQLKMLKGKILATLFFEPSTRTRLSFESAMTRLGGSVIGFSGTEGTSVRKGETLQDTVRNVENYADGIAMRHPLEGSARLAAQSVKIPVINGGDGANQHPTQALLDLFTIKQEKDLRNTRVALCGDLKYGRTVHSLMYLLPMFGTEISIVSPEVLGMPEHIMDEVEGRYGTRPEKQASLKEAVKWADVLYVTRIQRERFPDPNEYERVAGSYVVDSRLLSGAKKDMVILHPLPRVDEIKPEVDSTPYAKYFDQTFYGVVVRMALLNMLMGGGRHG